MASLVVSCMQWQDKEERNCNNNRYYLFQIDFEALSNPRQYPDLNMSKSKITILASDSDSDNNMSGSAIGKF
jgi:hypothetical protein